MAHVLFSHRVHALGRSAIGLDQAIAPTFSLRRITLRGLTQDQRISRSLLGVDRPRRRHTLTIPLCGFSKETIDNRELHVGAGSVLHVPVGATCAGRASGDLLELEWDDGALGQATREMAVDAARLGEATMRAAQDVADKLARPVSALGFRAALKALLRALTSEGVTFDVDALETIPTATAGEQRLHECIDARLSSLESSPMLVDLETLLNVSTRTLTRQVRSLQDRYRLPGGETWRKLRDHYRLVVATILLSHDDASARSVALSVGYGSVEALCHAFRSVDLPAPDAYHRTVLAA